MTISLTAMVLESTNTLSFSAPITATVMVWKKKGGRENWERGDMSVRRGGGIEVEKGMVNEWRRMSIRKVKRIDSTGMILLT